MQIKTTKLPDGSLEIEGELGAADFAKYEEEAVKKLSVNLELPGFRKGHIPQEVAIKNIPEIKILEEMAGIALPKTYLEILKQEKIAAIGQPEITITKIARNNPLGFKIKTAVMPEIKLPDYKNLAKEAVKNLPEEKKDVSEEEIEQAILEIRKIRMEHKHTPGEECKEELPEFNDEFVKKLGNFSSVEEFRNKLRENIRLEKEMRGRDLRRLKIIEQILGKTELAVPEIIVETELNHMIGRLRTDLEMGGFKFEDYLKQINKTEEDIRKEWRAGAIKNAQVGLILNKIAEAEKLDDYEKVFSLLENQK